MTMLRYDADKVDEIMLAVLYLTLDQEGRAWKGMDFNVSDRLYQKGWIEDPISENKSIELTRRGREASAALFERYFAVVEIQQNEEVSEVSTILEIPVIEFEYFYGDDEDDGSIFLDCLTGQLVSRPQIAHMREDETIYRAKNGLPAWHFGIGSRFLLIPYKNLQYALDGARKWTKRLPDSARKTALMEWLKTSMDSSEPSFEHPDFLERWDQFLSSKFQKRVQEWIKVNSQAGG